VIADEADDPANDAAIAQRLRVVGPVANQHRLDRGLG
jgi:hypothetical protein